MVNSLHFDSLASPFMANMLLATTPNLVNSLVPPVAITGRITEYSPVGDGVHLRQHQSLPLLPLLERGRPRPHALVRKVSVVGSHVLRYVGRHSNISARRHQLRNIQRVRTSSIDQHTDYAIDDNNDRMDDVDWLDQNVEPAIASSGLVRIERPESYAVRLMLPPSSEDSSILGLFNWKIYVGMLCIIAVQALLKMAYQEMFRMT